MIGIGLALTGPIAEYGQAFKKGAELALEEINSSGGIHGLHLNIDFQDTQGNVGQAVAVAQKFIANPQILLASILNNGNMEVNALFQRAQLVHFGFGSTQPSFTLTGDYIWGNAPLLEKESIAHVAYVKTLGLKKVAIFSVHNDWGKMNADMIKAHLSKEGIQLALRENYSLSEKDFRPLVSKAKALEIDGLIIIGYVKDVSILVQQIRSQGMRKPIVANGAMATNQFPQLAGNASEGVHIAGDFSADDPRPEVAKLAQKWMAKYPQDEMEYFSVHAYDSVILAAEVLKLSDGTRASVKEAFAQVKDVPSVIYGKVTFDQVTRRVDAFLGARLVVKNGKIVRWEENQ